MNWLETHIRGFVVPFILYGTPKKRFTGEMRPASGTQYPEAGIIKAALKSRGFWDSNNHLAAGFEGFPTKALPKWSNASKLELETCNLFKRFRLQTSASDGDFYYGGHTIQKQGNIAHLSNEDIVHTLLKRSVFDLRDRLKNKPNNKVLLLGRDVWGWAVLCEKYNVKYVYDPVVSRNIANSTKTLDSVISRLDVHEGDILFDTGFAGSIHRAVQDIVPCKIENLMLSANNRAFQQFPNHGLARNRALFIEYLPKFFSAGYVGDNYTAEQSEMPLDTFIRSALLTCWFWHYQSPRWIPGPTYHKIGGIRTGFKPWGL